MPNYGYEAGRDHEYESRLDRAIDDFANSYENDLSPDRTTVFLFPGGMGSQLMRARSPYTRPPFTYYKSWLARNILGGEAKNLQIEPNGVDYEQQYVVPDGGIDFDCPFVHLHPYADFITWCKNNSIHLFVFGWDWRRGVQHSTDFFLDNFLPKFKARFDSVTPHPLDNFTLIGHSAGGMVVKVIANQAANPYVQRMKRAITVASPFYGYGAQIHLYIMGHHDLNATIGGPEAARTMAGIVSTMPGGYEFVYLDKLTYDANANAFANDPEGYNLLSYPSMDKANPSEAADPYNPTDASGKVRYPLGYGFRKDLLIEGIAGSRKVSSRLDPGIAAKFYSIRGVQAKNGNILQETVVSQRWKRVVPNFNPDAPVLDPIADIPGPGDGVQPAWGARLLGLPPAQVITVVDNIEHVTMMNAPSVQNEIATLLGLDLTTVTFMKPTEVPVASRKDVNDFLTGLRREVTDKQLAPEDLHKALAGYLGKFKREQLGALFARAYIDLLKSPSQVVSPSTVPKQKKATKKPAPRSERGRKGE